MRERGKVKVIISNDQKVHKIPTGIHLLVRQCCIAVLTMENLLSPAEISVRFVDNEEIHKLNKEYRITVIIVSHDIDNALKNASHVLHLRKNGYFYGTKEDYLQSKEYKSFCE